MRHDALAETGVKLEAKPMEARARIASRTARALSRTAASGDREAALLLARALVRDVAVIVRQTFAEGVAGSPFLPKDLAREIARDIPEVAAPFLRASPALDDADLAELVGALDSRTLPAVAARDGVGGSLALALVRTGVMDVLRTLAANESADLSESWPELLAAVEGDETSLNSLAGRETLPAEVVLALFESVSEALRAKLVARHGVPDFLGPIAVEARNAGFARALARCETQTAVQLAADIERAGKLTPLIVLEIIRAGNLPVIEATVERRTGAPVADVRRTLRFGTRHEAVVMLEAAGVPKALSARAWDALAAARARFRAGRPDQAEAASAPGAMLAGHAAPDADQFP